MADDLFRILLVEDDSVDGSFVIRAFQECSGRVSIRHLEEASDVMAELQVRPYNIVILDINLNGSSGFDVIRSIRNFDKTELLPIVMFTSSSSAGDILEAYRLGANAYVEKPLSIQGYRQFATKFLGFWAETALLPAV